MNYNKSELNQVILFLYNLSMDHNRSPWIAQLNKERKSHTHNLKDKYDVAIIGGGISGMVTAYYTLKHTKKIVLLLEANKIAHGATGHNAGYVGDYFEKPYSEIAEEYGHRMAAEGQEAVTSSWDLVLDILKETNINIPFPRFVGYAGCTTFDQLFLHLENKRQKRMSGLHVQRALLAKELIHKEDIPERYKDLVEFVPHSHVLLCLETPNKAYMAALQSKKGTMNSALFVEKLSEYLLRTYQNRFFIREHTPVTEVNLYKNHVNVETNHGKVDVENVVLCTNGFENFTLTNHYGARIDHKFHDNIRGIVGYMAGYIDTRNLPSMAISYFPKKETVSGDDPYFYLTRRKHMWDEINKPLVCIGGPEEIHEELRNYSSHYPYSKTAFEEMDRFLKETYPESTRNGINYVFKWHGIMGYTKSGIRSVGFEPANNRLLYNLGCNGMGILPSIYGGKKISHHLAGDFVKLSIFDPIIQQRVHALR